MSNEKSQREHFGLYTAEIDHEGQTVELILKRYHEKVLDATVDKLRVWAVRSIEKKFPGYEVADNGTK